MRDANLIADRGSAALDRRIIPDSFDWRDYDIAPERTKVLPASSFADALVEQVVGEKRNAGAFWPWDKANDLGLRFRPQEVTVYAGINGHRKSLIVGQIALHLMRQDERCLVASFEMSPHKTLERMVKQAAATGEPSLRYVRAWSAWSDGRLWLYDHLGQCDARRVLAVSRYAATELGVQHVFLDSLMKITRSVDDYNEQKRFLAELCAFAMAANVHVHLVAHARKGRAEEDALDKFDVKGAGEIIDQAHNAVLVQKNLKLVEGSGDCDQFVTIAKQRDGAFEGTMGLWFNDQALTLGEKPGGRWPHIAVGMV